MSPEKKDYSEEILKGPFRFRLFKPFVPKERALELLEDCFERGWIGEGPKVKEFEGLVSALIGNDRVTAVNSGTSALEMALNFVKGEPGLPGRKVEKGLVITTPMTCMATTIAILNAGLRPHFVDIDPRTGLLSPEAVRGVSTEVAERAAAIMTVHWGGNTANMAELGAVAERMGLPIIEDAAHALGSATPARVGGASIVGGDCTFAGFSCFSFQAIKHVTTGDGGAVSFARDEDFERSKPYKWFGIPRDEREEHILGHSSYDIVEAGRKWQMNDVAASIGIASFGQLAENLKQRRAVAAVYDREISEIESADDNKFPTRVKNSEGCAFWLYTVFVRDPYDFSESMRREGIEVSNVHIRNDAYSVTREVTGGRLSLPALDYFSEHAMCIPVGPWISEEDAELIAGKVKEFGC